LVRAFFYGSVLAFLCFRHGFFPLHAAAVLLEQGAVAFSGPSGAGKSTLASALALRGHILLSDDLCILDVSESSRPMLWPAFPRVRLREDAIASFGLGEATMYTRSASAE
jgi:hypothetical protein